MDSHRLRPGAHSCTQPDLITRLRPASHSIQESHQKAFRLVTMARKAVGEGISVSCDLKDAQKALVLVAGPPNEAFHAGLHDHSTLDRPQYLRPGSAFRGLSGQHHTVYCRPDRPCRAFPRPRVESLRRKEGERSDRKFRARACRPVTRVGQSLSNGIFPTPSLF